MRMIHSKILLILRGHKSSKQMHHINLLANHHDSKTVFTVPCEAQTYNYPGFYRVLPTISSFSWVILGPASRRAPWNSWPSCAPLDRIFNSFSLEALAIWFDEYQILYLTRIFTMGMLWMPCVIEENTLLSIHVQHMSKVYRLLYMHHHSLFGNPQQTPHSFHSFCWPCHVFSSNSACCSWAQALSGWKGPHLIKLPTHAKVSARVQQRSFDDKSTRIKVHCPLRPIAVNILLGLTQMPTTGPVNSLDSACLLVCLMSFKMFQTKILATTLEEFWNPLDIVIFQTQRKNFEWNDMHVHLSYM